MDELTLRSIGHSIVASPLFNDETTLVWHAGEPCALPPAWYRSAIASIEESAGRKIPRQALQTNATLLSDEWIEFFKEFPVSVGVSLDGPAWINDARRVTRSGKGTYATVKAGIDRLRAAEIPFHIIAVVTAEALAHPKEFASALAATGAYSIGLNIEEIEGDNSHSSLFISGAENSYSRFLNTFLDTIEQMESPPRLREYERFENSLRHGAGVTRHMENTPGAIISVAHDGALATFSPELLGTQSDRYNNFVFGNVQKMSDVARMFLNPAYLRALVDIHAGVTACRKSCRYFSVCGGGSPSNKLGENGQFDSTETEFCRLSVMATFSTFLGRAGVKV